MKIEEMKAKEDVPVIIADAQGIVIYTNTAFESCFGWSNDEILGKPLATIIPEQLQDAHHLGFSRFLETEKPTLLGQPLTLKAIKKDGTEFDAEHFIIAEKLDSNWTFAATIKPL